MARPKKTSRPKSTRRALSITDDLAAELDKIMSLGEGKPPISVIATVGGNGVFRRVVAEYANGFNLRLNFNAKGQVSSYSGSIHFSNEIRVNEVEAA